ncbi:MAG: YecA family protein [Chloroflexota bacterium]
MTTSIILTILITIVLLAIGGGLIVLIAYGIGWLIHFVTKFDLFQSTLLGLAGMFAFGILAERTFSAITSIARNDLGGEEFEDYYDDDFEDEFDDDFGEDEEEPSDAYPGIPRWRQPLKQVDFSKARPNDLCPCGSGRKFKHCHGAKRPTT